MHEPAREEATPCIQLAANYNTVIKWIKEHMVTDGIISHRTTEAILYSGTAKIACVQGYQ